MNRRAVLSSVAATGALGAAGCIDRFRSGNGDGEEPSHHFELTVQNDHEEPYEVTAEMTDDDEEVVFAWAADLDRVRSDLGSFHPVVRYVVPAVLLVVTGAKGLGVARPAWRLLVGRARDGSLGVAVAALAFALLLGAGVAIQRRRVGTR